MIPKLYGKDETAFTSQGIGALADCISCTVTEEINGSYELTMKYPVHGLHFEDLNLRNLILAKANEEDQPQPFRIYKISKAINGIVTVSAQHISYDLIYVPLTPFSVTTFGSFKTQFANPYYGSNPFTLSAGNSLAIWSGEVKREQVCTARDALLGKDGLTEIFGGELKFDRFSVLHYGRNNGEGWARGDDRKVVIKYGKQLTNLTAVEETKYTCALMYINMQPYPLSDTAAYYSYDPQNIDNVIWRGRSGYMVDISRPMPIEASDYVPEGADPWSEAVRTAAFKACLKDRKNELSAYMLPSVTMSINLVPLWQTAEYKDLAYLERINLGDIVTILFADMGISRKAEVMSATYDTLAERFTAFSIGNKQKDVADTIFRMQQILKTS